MIFGIFLGENGEFQDSWGFWMIFLGDLMIFLEEWGFLPSTREILWVILDDFLLGDFGDLSLRMGDS